MQGWRWWVCELTTLIMTRFVCLLMVMMTLSARAAEPVENKLPVVTFGPFPALARTCVVQGETGQPGSGLVRPDDSFNPDHPPFIRIGFGEVADNQGYSDYSLTVYRVGEVNQTLYPTVQPLVEKLRKLLTTRSKGDLDRLGVPVYPIRNAGELIQAKTQYFDANWGSGIFFVTSFSSGVEEYPDNHTLEYLFEGLSKDGKFLVSASFKITHPNLSSPGYRPHLSGTSGPLDAPVRRVGQAAADAATAKAQAFLPRQPDNSFHPSLGKIRQWVATLTVREPSL